VPTLFRRAASARASFTEKWCPGPESKPKTIGGDLRDIYGVYAATYPSRYPSGNFPTRPTTIRRPTSGQAFCDARHTIMQYRKTLNGCAPNIFAMPGRAP
jgi:hypothetical protein